MTKKLDLHLLKVRILNRGPQNSNRLVFSRIERFLGHSTPRKFVNLIAAKTQKWLKLDRIWGMPYRYTIDPINICNLRCPLCPTGLGKLGREQGKMTLNRYKALIDQIVPYAYSVELYNWGEPFLHPGIFDMIEYASSRKISVSLSSNLNYFTREMARKTVRAGLDMIIISVDGATQETYGKYRRRGNLDKVMEHIKLLVEEKYKAHSRSPFITFRMLVNRYNEGEIHEAREIANKLGVDAFTTGTIFIDTTNPDQIKEWLPVRADLSYYDYSAEKIENVWNCADLWESVTINWDGGLAPCCWLHENKHDYDNVLNRPLKEIWNGDAYVSSRRVFALGRPKGGSLKTICTVCKGHPLYLKD
jgi:MoaA/NifB/PqqE/SkfB family radical SAM enzyme